MNAAYRRRLLITTLVAVTAAACRPSDPQSPTASPSYHGTSPTAIPSATSPPTTDESPIATGQVVATEPLVLRSAPGTGTDSRILEGMLWPGMRFAIEDGPIAASGYEWYAVRVGSLSGWAAAASREGEPWLMGVRNGGLAYGDLVDDVPQVFLDPLDGSPARQLTELTQADVTVTPISGAPAARLVISCGYGIHQMAWSPSGRDLAFAAGGCDTVILTVRADGGGAVRLADGSRPAWTPDGASIAYGPHLFASVGEIQTVAISGGVSRPLTADGGWSSGPAWSPDGSTLAYTWASDFLSSRQAGRVISREGGASRELAPGSVSGWIPDGSGLIMTTNPRTADPDPDTLLAAADGSGTTLFSNGMAVWPGFWAHDFGLLLAAETLPDTGDTLLHLLDPDGTDLGTLPIGQYPLGWSPDGRWILLSQATSDGSALDVIAVAVADRSTRLLTTLAGTGSSGFAWQPVLVPLGDD